MGIAAVGLGILLTLWTWTRAASMSADGAHYMELAERAWRIGPQAAMDWYSGPGYPVAVGWLYGLTGDLDFAGRLAAFLFGVATLAGVGVLGSRLFGRTVAGLAVGLVAVHVTFVRHAAMAETDTAYLCWSVWSVFFTWQLKHAHGFARQAGWAVLTGLSLGLGYLTRPEAVPLAGLLGLWYLWPPRAGLSQHGMRETGDERRETEGVRDARTTRFWDRLFSPRPSSARGEGPGVRDDSRSLQRTSVPSLSSLVFRRSSLVARLAHAPLVRRCAWATVVGTLFVLVASPYLLQLRRELGRWSLSGKERSIVLKFVPDKQNYEQVLQLGISGAILRQPSSLLHWLPYHLYWGLPQFVKGLHPVVLVLAAFGLWRAGRRRSGVRGQRSEVRDQGSEITAEGPLTTHHSPLTSFAPGGVRFLLWVSVPFILFFFLTFPGRRYFMQTLPQWTILAAVGTVELSRIVASWRPACTLAAACPALVLAACTLLGNLEPLESSRLTERAVGERILQIAGPGRRVLGFTIPAFYARAERVPLWGPMQGIVRCHGYGQPLSYEELREYCRRHCVEFVVLDHDLRKDCPTFLERVRPDEFELVSDDIHDRQGPCVVYRRREHREAGRSAN